MRHPRHRDRSPKRRATVALLAATCLPVHSAWATPCFDYGQVTEAVGSVNIGAGGLSVEVVGGLAYVAVGANGLVIVDVSRPDQPRVLGSVDTPGDRHSSANCVAVRGAWAYVAGGPWGLQVVDVSDPHHPRIAAGVATPGDACEVAVSEGYAYVTLGSDGLSVVDVTDPGAARVVAHLATGSPAFGIALAGGCAYLAAGSGGLQVADVSDPLRPELLATAGAPGWHVDVAVDGDRAYLVGSRLTVLDITDPAAPRFLGDVQAHLGLDEVAALGPLVCTVGSGGLQLADVSDPSAPTWLEDVLIADAAFGLDVENGLAFAAAPGKVFHILRLPRPERPLRGMADTPGTAVGVAGLEDYAYLADWEEGLAIADVHDVDAPWLVASLPLAGFAQGLHVARNMVYVAARTAGMHVVDASDPMHPRITGSLDTPGDAWDVSAAGHRAYIADGPAGVQVVDLTNPSLPVIVETLDTPGACTALAMEADRLYVADGFSGVRILDLSTSPASWAGFVSMAGYALDVAIRDRILWIADLWGALLVVDVGDASRPQVLARIEVPGATALSQDEQAVYVACGPEGVFVVDPTAPGAPRIVGRARPPAPATAVAAASGRVLVATGVGGLATLLPHCRYTTPVWVSDLEAIATRSGILIRWRTDSQSPGVQRILRARDDDLRFAAIAEVAVPPSGVREFLDGTVVAARYAYTIAASQPGVGDVIAGPVYVTARPAVLDLSPPVPNPMRRETTVHVRAPSGVRCRIAVYDVAGRLVRELARTSSTAPARSVSWDGRDTRGTEVAPGVYLLRLEGGGLVVARQVTRVR